jgi:TonB family protein
LLFLIVVLITIVKFEINTVGSVNAVNIQSSSGHEELDLAAIRAIQNCIFNPRLVNGAPVAQASTMSFRWKLDMDQQSRSINRTVSLNQLRNFLSSNWPNWSEDTINSAINFEALKIKEKYPHYSQDEIEKAVGELWRQRAEAKNNTQNSTVQIKNEMNLGDVNPLEWNFIYSIPNFQVCEPRIPKVRCISYVDYKKACLAAKNISWQAVSGSMFIDEGLPRRLFERSPKYSNINIKWNDNKCIFSYEIWANFNGKPSGCRQYGLATGFAFDLDRKFVINHASPLLPEPADSTCRLN